MNELMCFTVSEECITLHFLGSEKKTIPLKEVEGYQRMGNQFCVVADQQYYFNALTKKEASQIERFLKRR